MAKCWLLASCLVAALACCPNAHADEFDWLATFGVSYVAHQNNFAYRDHPKVAVDAAGNTYVVGHFKDTVDFDPGPGVFELTSTGHFDVFVLKLNPMGELAWAVHVGGTHVDRAADVAVDGSGNVHVVGDFTGTADFDPGPGEYPLVAEGGGDIFLLKLTTAGEFAWAHSLTTEAGQSFVGAVFATTERVYVVGHIVFPADFDPGPDVLELRDGFVWTLNQDGALVWAVGGLAAGWDGLSDVTAAGGFVYVTGMFSGTRDFNPGPGVFWLEGGCADVFVLKLSIDGDFIWARSTQDDPCRGIVMWQNWPTGIAVDDDGNVYTVGELEGRSVDFDPGPDVFELNWDGFFL